MAYRIEDRKVMVDETTRKVIGWVGSDGQPQEVPSLVSGAWNLGALGDSRTDSMDVLGVTNTYYTHDWLPTSLARTGWPMKIVYSGGVSGDTTAQVAARVPALIASGAKCVTLLCGTNDGWTTTANVDASLVTRRQITDALIAAGVYVYSLSEMPNTTKSSAWHDFAVYFNRQEAAYWAGRSQGEFVDVYSPLLVPATGIGDSACFHDGLHQNAQGAYRMATVLAPRIAAKGSVAGRPLVGSVRDYIGTVAGSKQYVANPLMLGTGGTIGGGNSGTLPNGYQSVGTATCAFSGPARSDGVGNDLKAVVSATAGQIMEVYQSIPNFAGTVTGTKWVLQAEVVIEACSGLNEISISCSTDKFAFRGNSAIQPNGSLAITSPVTLRLQSPEFTVDASVSAPAYALAFFTLKGPTSGAFTATARLGRLSVERVA